MNGSETLISVSFCKDDSDDGILKVVTGRPTFAVSVFRVPRVGVVRPVEVREDTFVPFVLSDDGAQTVLWLHRQHQHSQFLAAVATNGGMFGVLKKTVANSFGADAALVNSPE